MIETDVLIIGGGPVGATLAGELGWRGVNCVLLEERTAPTEHPKATLLGARSMELFRRWGITDAIFARALPAEINYFITFSTRLAERELYRVVSPSIRETLERTPAVLAKYRELQWSPYYKTQIGQQALEPVLWEFAASLAPTRMRHGWRYLSHAQDGSGVTVEAVEVASGRRESLRARYMVACDGGSSAVRKQLGIRFNGRGKMRSNVSFYFKSRDFLKMHGKGLGNLYFIFSPDSFGVFTAVDGAELWSFQSYFLDPTQSTAALDAREVLYRAAGRPFEFELRNTQHWFHHQSVARQWRAGLDPCDSAGGRVFLAGDAAHLFVPTGGVGMNTGIGDAIDLGWKLSAVLAGAGGERLLASYEAERKPVAIRNSVISANNSDKIDMVMDETPPYINEASDKGEQARAVLAKKIRWMSRQFNSAGTHLGYRYVDSPVIQADGTPEPPDDPSQVVPGTWPGMRAPHAWLTADERADAPSTLDRFGRDWVLVQCAAEEGADGRRAALAAAFGRAGAPLRHERFATVALRRLYERDWVLVRPDGHVAWRADQLPAEPEQLADYLLGR